MRAFSNEELSEILKNHKTWLESGGKSGRRADLHGSNLSYADLGGYNLSYSDLSYADLRGANLSGANLSGANLHYTNLSGAKNIFIQSECPEKGSFIGFKKCVNNLIVELEIQEDSLRSSSSGRKCRCSKAKVLSITNIDGSRSSENYAVSIYDKNFRYKIGEIVTVVDFDTNRFNESSPGIHFFMTREEAVNY